MIMGCDRDLYLSLVLVCALLIVPAGIMRGQPSAIAIGVLLWIGGQLGLSKMGKRDAMMKHVFTRSLKYRAHYLGACEVLSVSYPRLPLLWQLILMWRRLFARRRHVSTIGYRPLSVNFSI